MKLFGHPLHPLLIHFPTALLPMDLVLSILFYTTGKTTYYEAGFYCLVGGVGIGMLAILSGLIELIFVVKTNKKATGLALYHGLINTVVLLVFAVLTYKTWKVFPVPYSTGTGIIIVKAFLILLLFVGNYLGGRLIYNYYVGLQNLKPDGKIPG